MKNTWIKALVLALALSLLLSVPTEAARSPEAEVVWLNTDQDMDTFPDEYFPEFNIVSCWLGRGYYDAGTGQKVTDHIHVSSLTCGRALFDQRVEGRRLYGYVDAAGNVAIPPVYRDAASFVDGLAAVQDAEHGRWGVINTAGETVIPIEYSSMQRVSDSRFAVTKGDDTAILLLDRDGREIVPVQPFQAIRAFSDGLALARVDDPVTGYAGTQYGYIDEEGRMVIPAEYGYANEFSQGRAVVSAEWDLCYIDTQGNRLNGECYDEAQPFSGGVACVGRENAQGETKYGLIDLVGNVILPLEYEDRIEFSEGLAVVSQRQEDGSRRYGYVDPAGNLAIPFRFSSAENFSEGMALVTDRSEAPGGEFGFIDRSGELVIPCQYDHADSFYGGLAGVYNKNEEWEITDARMINTTGETVFPYYGEVLTEGSVVTNYPLPVGGAPGRYAYVMDFETGRYGVVRNPYWTDPTPQPEPEDPAPQPEPEDPTPQPEPEDPAPQPEPEDPGAQQESGGFPVVPVVLAVIAAGAAGAAVLLRKKKR